jgi:hypothetical protein
VAGTGKPQTPHQHLIANQNDAQHSALMPIHLHPDAPPPASRHCHSHADWNPLLLLLLL